ncbi:membrane-associated protein, putative [Bodo saltans]|uniref:Membrane-associated protein, putative n=1 Tax=Bodo saltans TaxID=75058 RepID=A0A0S4IZP3_BODSA|nr:membrane-associated protein, putative [Bodo saltans]|eukprot:CUG09633.1 membrane-associated protein, putative [Bodo saltans]
MYAIIILAQLAALVVCAVSIPCVMQQPFTIRPNGHYVLENCTASPGVPPFVYLGTENPAPLALSNVTVDVIGGGVVPSINLGAAVISNVSVTMRGLRVGPFVFSPNRTDPSWVWLLSAPAVNNLSLTCIDVAMNITFVFDAAFIPAQVGLFVVFSADFGLISNISVLLLDSTVSFHYVALQPPIDITAELFACTIRIATFVNTSVGAVSISVINSSTFHIVNNSLALSNATSSAAVHFLAFNTHGQVKVSTVQMLVYNSSITVVGSFGGLIAENTTSGSVEGVGEMSVFSSPEIPFANLNVTFARSVVSIFSGWCYTCGSGSINFFATSLFVIDSRFVGGHVTVNFISTNVTLVSNGTTTNQRNAGAVAVMGDTTQNTITLRNCTIRIVVDSNLCSIASAVVLAIAGSTSQLSVLFSAVVLVATVVPSDNTNTILPTIPDVFNVMTMASSLLTVAPSSPSSVRSSSFSISDSHVIASHICNIPPSQTAVSFIASLVCAVTVIGTLADSTFDISSVSVTRRILDARNYPASWSNLNDSMLNVTTILQLSDLSSGPLSSLFQSGFPYAAQLAQIIVNSTINNVSATVDRNCVVAYDAAVSCVAPIATDVLSFVNLPTLLNASIVLVNTGLVSTMLPSAGQAVGVVGPVTVIGSTVIIQHVAQLSSLLDIVFASLIFVGARSQFTFRNMSLSASWVHNDSAPIGSRNAGTISYSGIRSLIEPALFTISHCAFVRFDALFSSSFVPSAIDGVILTSRILDLGCNLWNTAPLPVSVITAAMANTRAFRHSCVVYEPSAYNASLYCPGIVRSATARVSRTLLPQGSVSSSSRQSPRTQSRSPNRHTLLTSATFRSVVEELTALHDVTDLFATTTSSIATYASLVFSAARGAAGIATIQRSMLAINLASMCLASRSGGDDTGSEQQSFIAADEATAFSNMFFNPLSLSVPVGITFLNNAAGTLIGNTLMACFIGSVSHFAWRMGGKHAESPLMKVVSMFVLVFPLPGSLANIANSLLQPSIGAVVSLVVSSERAPSSVVVGVVLCVPWIAYLVHGSWWMLLRGHPAGQFILNCKANHSKPVLLSCHPQQLDGNSIAKTIASFVANALAARTEWMIPRPHGSDGSGDDPQLGARFLLRRLKPMFERFTVNREWYCVVEWAMLLLGSVVLGVATALSADSGSATCSVARWGAGCMLALGLVSVVAAAALRPFSVPLELWMALLLGTMECLGTALVLANDVYAAQIVVTISAVVETCVCVLPMILAATKVGVCSFIMCDQRDMQRSEEEETNVVASRRVRKGGTRLITGANVRVVNVFEATQQAQLRALVELVCSTASRSK